MNKPGNSTTSWSQAGAGMARITLATLGFAVWHSFLCSRQAKEGAKKLFGQKRGTAYYRAFFMAQSAVTFGALLLLIFTQPHRVLYRAQGWKRLLCWGGQGSALLIAGLAIRELDKPKFIGIKGVQSLQEKKAVEAEAQGPELENEEHVRACGIFRYTRHPLEWAPALLLLATPTMKTNWLAFDIMAAIYSYVGALHEEKRLLEKSGEYYAAYQKQVPFFFGRPKPDAEG